MVGAGGEGEADADLAIGDLARGAGVLTLNADRVLALFEPAAVVDDPVFDRLALGQGVERAVGSDKADIAIAPVGIDHEVTEPLMQSIGLGGIGAGAGGDRLDALALGIAEQAERVQRERGAPLLVAEHVSDAIEVGLQPRLTVVIEEKIHAPS